jgi:hypothetical protein
VTGPNEDVYAEQVLKAGRDCGIAPRGIVIGFATVFVESGWVMYANEADPDSLSFPHEALSTDANSVGLFQQRAEWWGTCAQRMDPYQSAAMFFNRLKQFDYMDLSQTPGYWAQQVQGSAYPDRYDQHMGDAQALYDRLTAVTVTVLAANKGQGMQKILNYPRGSVGNYSGVVQQYGWDCGPTATSVVLSGCGVDDSQDFLIQQIGTTTNGTNSVDDIVPVLNAALPSAHYRSVWLSNDPPSADQVEALWTNVKGSIDAGFGAVLNFESPPDNRPQGVNGSVSPNYPTDGSTIEHYVACEGYSDDGLRAFWIADPGFPPFGYWCSLSQVAELIVPHAYCFATAPPVAPPAPVAAPVAPPQPAPAQPPQPAPEGPQISTETAATATAGETLPELWTEWDAVEYSDHNAIQQIVTAAKNGDPHSILALAMLERTNPSALQAFINSLKGN